MSGDARTGWRWYLAAIFASAAGLIAYPWWYTAFEPGLQFSPWDFGKVSFVATLGGVALFLTGLGVSITGKRRGILLNGRNSFSLSRFQMVVWSWLIISAIVSVASARAWGYGGATLSGGLAIEIPGELLSVMGISLLSAAVAPSVLALKRDRGFDRGRIDRERGLILTAKLGRRVYVRDRQVFRGSRDDARLEDMIRGDDDTTVDLIDLGKVQNLLLTLIVAGYYGAMLFQLFSMGFNTCDTKGACATHLPALMPGMVTLLLISHGGYLAYKGTPKPEPQDSEVPRAETGPASRGPLAKSAGDTDDTTPRARGGGRRGTR